MAAEKGHPWTTRLLEYYIDRSFYKEDGSLDTTPNTQIISDVSQSDFGYEPLNVTGDELVILDDDINIYPWFVFCPKSHLDGKIRLREETYAIHHFNGSWLTRKQKIRKEFVKILVRFIGLNNVVRIRNAIK